jgi:hypothetical protein
MSELDQNQLAQIKQSVRLTKFNFLKSWCTKSYRFFKKLVTVTEIKLAEIKETKQYKGLKHN